MRTLCLSLHAPYRCHHSGACCQSWTVPAELRVIQLIEARRIRPIGGQGRWFVNAEHPRDVATWNLVRDAGGSCVFFDRDAGRLCVIHREAGPEALPSACRHFPRKILRDRRGAFVSLSHFCPTAAGMLLTPDPLKIVEAHPPLRLSEPVEGLEATDALPPLLRPGVLTDLEGYGAWEQAGITTFARGDLRYHEALDLVAAATEAVREWQPGSGALAERVDTAFRQARMESGADAQAQARTIDTVRSVCAGRLPSDVARIDRLPGSFEENWQELVAPSFHRFDVAMKNYLAARLFANWVAYQGRGLRSIVEWLRTCAAIVRHQTLRRAIESRSAPGPDDFVEAVRTTDFLLLHVVDSQALARKFAAIEGIKVL
jgi:Fe-S-cluster containining protein